MKRLTICWFLYGKASITIRIEQLGFLRSFLADKISGRGQAHGRIHCELAHVTTHSHNPGMTSSEPNPSANLQTGFSFWSSKV
jgi:hypothetical protein